MFPLPLRAVAVAVALLPSVVGAAPLTLAQALGLTEQAPSSAKAA